MGRFVFKYFYWVLKVIIYILKLLPSFVSQFFFSLFAGFPGSVGVLCRYVFLSAVVKEIGKNVYIARWVVIKNPSGLALGDNVSIHEFGFIDAIGGVNIGNNVSIAHSCSFVSFEHTWKNNSIPIKYNELCLNAITIHDDVWLGCGVRVLSGSTICTRTIVGAGAVFTKNSNIVFDSGLFLGCPAKRVSEL